ncbi:MAG: hypothetical protein HKN42_02575 [Granulosicoccus sp.]|nr:hypothetical protein [Granulosicoccus sp.]
MGSLHHLPTAANAHARLLEQLVSETIARHPDRAVAEIWAVMARETISRYAAPPAPSQPVLDLDKVSGLTPLQCQQMHAVTQSWLESYLNDVRNQLMGIHRDLLGLQKRVAELEVERQRSLSP